MPLSLVRVDDRLIHGQVVAVWLRALGADRIVIVDDATASDEFLREILCLAAPAEVRVEIFSVIDALSPVTTYATHPDRTFVLMKSPVTALALRRGGVPFEVLNVGGIGARPGRNPLFRNISASDEEIKAMRALEELGTRVEFRIVADDRAVPFTSLDRA
jgi:PTS system mannose-specific IIB component